jgi:rubrerythrin
MDRISSIELAMKNEQSEKEFYLNQARRTKNVVARVLFEALAEDEDEHKRRLAKLHETLKRDGAWPENVPIEIAGTSVRQKIDAVGRGTTDVAAHDGDDLAALRKSESFESAGADFYRNLAEACTNPQEAEFFRFLSKIEREHLMSVRDSIYYLEDPSGWLASRERSGLDGA